MTQSNEINTKIINVQEGPSLEYVDNYDDQVITVKLPRKDYEIMRLLIKREQTLNNVTNILRSSWVWIVGGGILTLWLLWDKIKLEMGI